MRAPIGTRLVAAWVAASIAAWALACGELGNPPKSSRTGPMLWTDGTSSLVTSTQSMAADGSTGLLGRFPPGSLQHVDEPAPRGSTITIVTVSVDWSRRDMPGSVDLETLLTMRDGSVIRRRWRAAPGLRVYRAAFSVEQAPEQAVTQLI